MRARRPDSFAMRFANSLIVAADGSFRRWVSILGPMQSQEHLMSSFNDPQAVARYAEGPVRQVPGFHALQRMTALLLAETVPHDGRVLVLGAGGGLELKVFAEAQEAWRLVGVDPSAEMLKLARDTLGPLASRIELHEGYIDTAPEGPFDGATCLLTLHFLPAEERLQTLIELRRRLKPGASLIVAHHSIPQSEDRKARWLNRYAAFAVASGIPTADANNARVGIGNRLPMLSPEEDIALLQQAGFADVELFYAAFTFKGWVASIPA
jgi:tRNA (cmo5U34)-methyltransferase